MPANKSGWTFAVNDNHERLVHAKKRYFARLKEGYEPRGPRAKQLRSFFSACMDEPSAAKAENDFANEQRRAINEVRSRGDLFKLLRARVNTPLDTVFRREADADLEDPGQFDYAVTSKFMTLPDKSYYKDHALLKDFQGVIETLLKSVGEENAKERARRIIDIEKRFARAYPDSSEIRRRGAQDTYWPRAKMLKAYPSLPLSSIFERLPAKIRIRNRIPEALAAANRILEKTSIDDLKAYILFRTLQDRLDDGFPEYFNKKFHLEKTYFGGPEQRPSREERCTQLVMNSFPFEVDEELIPILFPDAPKDRVRSLAERVRTALISQLKSNTWLSPEAKKEAIKKMEVAQLSVATPDREEDWDFRPVRTYNPGNPIQNQLTLEQAILDQTFDHLKGARNRQIWYLSPLVFNAYYVPGDNRLSILLAMIQPPYFDPSRSDIENLAAIGSMAGHELGHGIDDKGAKYDHTGKLHQWMTKKDLSEFHKRAKKFEKRFDEIGHDGRLTLGENIGDHMGLRSAFLAAFPDKSSAKLEDIKRFFVAYAQTYCEVNKPELETMLLKTDSHALGRARINEQVSHLDDFHRAYECKQGDPMYRSPADRFLVW